MKDPHGMVMERDEVDYSDLKEFGEVTVKYNGGELSITVSGFEFEYQGSCRQNTTKALAWLRDILTQQIEINRLMPGGVVKVGAD